MWWHLMICEVIRFIIDIQLLYMFYMLYMDENVTLRNNYILKINTL